MSVAASAVAQHVQRAFLSGAHIFDVDDEKVLLAIPDASRCDDPHPKDSNGDR